MKKYFLSTLLLVIIVVTQSCKSGGGSSPTAAIKLMAADVKDGDFKAMGKHMCSADAKMMDQLTSMIEGMAKLAGKDIKELMKEQMAKNKDFNFTDVEFKNEKITGDKATVDAYSKKEDKTETINFTKESGAWKICMGIADKANAALSNGLGGADSPKNMEDVLEKLKDPKIQEQLKNAQEMLKSAKPEDMQKMKEALEKMGKTQ
jgi:Domain of unknown function (DUF4878)